MLTLFSSFIIIIIIIIIKNEKIRVTLRERMQGHFTYKLTTFNWTFLFFMQFMILFVVSSRLIFSRFVH